MNMQRLLGRVLVKLLRPVFHVYQQLRVLKYKLMSDAKNVESLAQFAQPVLLTGRGKITFNECSLGVWPSPQYFNGYIHVEARQPGAEVIIGQGTVVNNNAVIIAEKARVEIGKNVLIGAEFNVFDSDFHGLHPADRNAGQHLAADVLIGDNVFIGSRVTVLKGVTIGENSVIGNGSVVNKNVPPNVIAAGVPVRIIRKL